MAEPSSDWQHTLIPLESAINRQADANLKAPFVRLWQAFLSGRVLLAVALLLLQTLNLQLQKISSPLVWLICIVYLALTLIMRLVAGRNLPAPSAGMQWLPVIGVDLAVIFLLQVLQAGSLNYTALLAIPILISSALGGLMLAFGTTAAVTLLMLGYTFWQQSHGFSDTAQAYYQTAFSCAGYFCVAYLTHELAKRVRRERAAALYNQVRTKTQEQVNALVINHLSDGVLVVDSSLQVMQANPAALRLLGLPELHAQNFSLQTQPWWQPLTEVVQTTFSHARPLSVTVHLQANEQGTTTGLDVRARVTEVETSYLNSAPGPSVSHSLCVMFLHDLREMEAQMRTEKLASMGRMSAAVAHEIRNPLAAITQANALLAEDLSSQPTQQQLCRIVGQNADRLARIAEEILNIARVQQGSDTSPAQTLALDTQLALSSQEWQGQTSPPRQLLLQLNAPARHIVFDEEHLRRVLINLLDNAQRHRSNTSHPASLQLVSGHGCEELQIQYAPLQDSSWFMVWSDGAPLEASVQRHLFEPFFSSQSRSSGLGLYICRELCQRYGASISYQRLTRDGVSGNAFIVSLRSGPATATNRPLFDSIMV
ncbi:MAG: PAS domain-containing protein [Comamonas sp.]|jgi:two-component system sensor histidine kinase PilS (NtrC family)|nr:PAS domain-containing protein [Comamonas sp.]